MVIQGQTLPGPFPAEGRHRTFLTVTAALVRVEDAILNTDPGSVLHRGACQAGAARRVMVG
jgi:hypothetical protein